MPNISTSPSEHAQAFMPSSTPHRLLRWNSPLLEALVLEHLLPALDMSNYTSRWLLHVHCWDLHVEVPTHRVGMGSLTPVFSRFACPLVLGSFAISKHMHILYIKYIYLIWFFGGSDCYLSMCRECLCVV